MTKFLHVLCCAGMVLGCAGAEARASDPASPADADSAFIRFVKTGRKQGHVDTAITTYRSPGGVTVALVAALHIADPSYYKLLNRRFEEYDTVLYEMIKDDTVRPERVSGSDHPISQMQIGMKSMLGLQFQLKGIDYAKPNFVHADMDPETFARMQGQKGENILTLLIQAAIHERQLQLASKTRPISGLELLIALTRDDSAHALKWIFARELNNVEMMISGIDQGADGEGSVIVSERNKVALSVLQDQIEGGKRKLAIFYGAGHMPDLEERLLGMKYRKVAEEWIIAWELRRNKGVKDTAGKVGR